MIGINQITAAYTNCIFAIGVKLRGIRTKKIHAVFENNLDIYRLIIAAINKYFISLSLKIAPIVQLLRGIKAPFSGHSC